MRILITILTLCLVFPAGVFGLDNRAIRVEGFPTGITHTTADMLGPYADLSSYTSQTGIAFVNSNPDTITDSNNGFVTAGFVAGDTVQVSGSVDNNGLYMITSVAAGTLTLDSTAALNAESAGATVSLHEKPSFFVVNTLTYDTSVSYITRSNVPMRAGGFKDWILFSQKGNAIGMSEITGIVDAHDHVYTDYSGDNVAFYGQTAPVSAEGVAGLFLKRFCLDITGDGHVLQHVTIGSYDCVDTASVCDANWESYDCCTGLGEGTCGDNVDSLNITNSCGSTSQCDSWAHIDGAIIDHCTFLWSEDENVDILRADDVLFTYNIVGEACSYATHSKGEHSKGLMIGGNLGDSDSVLNFLGYGNLLVHNRDRNPLLQRGPHVAWVNNFIHNPGNTTGMYGQGYYTLTSRNGYHIAAAGNVLQDINYIWTFLGTPSSGSEMWFEDNKCDAGTQTNEEDWSLMYDSPSEDEYTLEQLKTEFRKEDPASFATSLDYGFTPLASTDVASTILNKVGAFPVNRTTIASKLANDALKNTGSYVNEPSWPTITSTSRLLDTGMATAGFGAFPTAPHDDAGNGRCNFLIWLDAITKSAESPYVAPPERSNDPALDTNCLAWYLFESVLTDSQGSETLTGSGSGGVETEYLAGTNEKYFGRYNDERYMGTIAARDYTNITEVVWELGQGGTVSNRTCYVGKSTLDGTSLDSITAWENQACADGNNTFTIDPAQSVSTGEAIIIYMDGNDTTDYPILIFNSSASVHADLNDRRLWGSDKTQTNADTSAEVNLKITTSNVTVNYSDTALEGDKSLSLGSGSYVYRNDADLGATFIGKNGATNRTGGMAMIFSASTLPTGGASKYLAGKEDVFGFYLFDDSGTVKLRLALGDGDMDQVYTHLTGISADTTYGAGWFWDHTANTAYIRLAKLTSGIWAVEGTDIEDSGTDFDLAASANEFEIGSYASANTFDGTIDDAAVFIDVLTAAEFLTWASGDYGAPAPTITSITLGDASYDSTDVDTDITLTMVMAESVVVEGNPYFEMETGATDMVCTFSSGSHTASLAFLCRLLAGMRSASLAKKSEEITIGTGGAIQDLNTVDMTTLTLPALTGTVDIAIPFVHRIPTDYADYAAIVTAYGYLMGNDIIEVMDDANITITDEDGTDGNPITIYLRAGYSGTLDLNSNDYIKVFAHPAATVSNSGGSGVTVTKFNGAAGM